MKTIKSYFVMRFSHALDGRAASAPKTLGARASAATALLNSERPVDAPRDDTATLEI